MALTGYRTLARGADASAEIEVRRSRFLAVLRRVEDEAAARALTAELRRAHHDARHHCAAFVIGPERMLQRASDDGEPAGTAGMPMLEVLRGCDDGGPLSDVAAVVVRWFGGTLLGSGGLVRAYSDAVTAALGAATFVRREPRTLVSVALPHGQAGRIEAELRSAGVTVAGIDYGAAARITLATDDPTALRARLAALTGGAAVPEVAGSTWVDLDPRGEL